MMRPCRTTPTPTQRPCDHSYVRLAPAPERTAPRIHHEGELIAFRASDRQPKPQSPDPIRLLFVCRDHAVLSPIAQGLARDAYKLLNIAVRSAGLSPVGVDPRAVATMAEIDIDIASMPPTAARDLDLASFEIVVSLGIHKLGVDHHQMVVAWDVPEFTRVTEATAGPRLRQVRDALSGRIRALGAILTATNRA